MVHFKHWLTQDGSFLMNNNKGTESFVKYGQKIRYENPERFKKPRTHLTFCKGKVSAEIFVCLKPTI